ncbi:U1 small nuclear ribonucleoprotein C [Thecaphora frezii]
MGKGKHYCDYCDVFLTHDSISVRKAHNSGRNHIQNVRDYYSGLDQDQVQAIVNSINKAYEERNLPKPKELERSFGMGASMTFGSGPLSGLGGPGGYGPRAALAAGPPPNGALGGGFNRYGPPSGADRGPPPSMGGGGYGRGPPPQSGPPLSASPHGNGNGAGGYPPRGPPPSMMGGAPNPPAGPPGGGYERRGPPPGYGAPPPGANGGYGSRPPPGQYSQPPPGYGPR